MISTYKKLEKRERNKKDKAWREAIKLRDKVCLICSRGEYLDCHHIIPRENKDFRWDIDNGILLCKNHHKWSRVNSPHRNPLIFFEQFKLLRPEQYSRIKDKYIKSIK
jgi:hypothetical protein